MRDIQYSNPVYVEIDGQPAIDLETHDPYLEAFHNAKKRHESSGASSWSTFSDKEMLDAAFDYYSHRDPADNSVVDEHELTFDGFKKAMVLIAGHHLDVVTLQEVFEHIDVNHSKTVDKDEFRMCHDKLIELASDPEYMKIKGFKQHFAQGFPLTYAVAKTARNVAHSMGKKEHAEHQYAANNLASYGSTQKLSAQQKQDRVDAHHAAFSSAACARGALKGMVCGCGFIILLIFFCEIAPIVLFWWAYMSNEYCDEPLHEFVLVQAINLSCISALSFYTWFKIFSQLCCHSSESADSKFKALMPTTDAKGSHAAAAFHCFQFCIGIFWIVWVIMGGVWFQGAGGLFGNPEVSNCETVAPHLWEACYIYFMYLFVVFACIIPALCFLLCIFKLVLKHELPNL